MPTTTAGTQAAAADPTVPPTDASSARAHPRVGLPAVRDAAAVMPPVTVPSKRKGASARPVRATPSKKARSLPTAESGPSTPGTATTKADEEDGSDEDDILTDARY